MKKLLVCFLVMISLPALGGPVEIEKLYLKGDGCAEGEVWPVLSPLRTVASILFDNFFMSYPFENPSPTGPKAFKKCDITLIVRAIKGHKIDSLKINYDLRGYALIGPGINVAFTARALSLSQRVGPTGRYQPVRSKRGHLFHKVWGHRGQTETLEEDFVEETETVIKEPFACSHSDELRWRIVIKNSAMLIAQGRAILNQEEGQFFLDSTDLSSNLKVQLNSSVCNN